jgi:DNA modification methylase
VAHGSFREALEQGVERPDIGINRAHPTEKAVSILTPLIQAFSKRGDLVLDPFSGSGSTAVAAALSGRRYIGGFLPWRFSNAGPVSLDSNGQ